MRRIVTPLTLSGGRLPRLATALAALVLLAPSFLLLSRPAHAATTYEIRVGHFFNSSPAESMRFFPPSIAIHQGDVLNFKSKGFHTATLLPAGSDAAEWVDDNASGFDEPFNFLVADPDDGADYKANNQALFSHTACGAPETPCAFSAQGGPTDGVLNSGVSFIGDLDFSAEINAVAGTSFSIVNLVHPNMHMRVTIVADDVAASDPAKLAAAQKAQIKADGDQAAAIDAQLRNAKSSHPGGSGTRVWDAWAGFDTRHISLYAFYPARLRIRAGDSVRWRFDTLTWEDHSVTGPLDEGGQIASEGFLPGCDPDGDTGPGPDYLPPDLGEPPFCNPPSEVEFDFPANFVESSGNGVVTKAQDFESSGLVGGGVGGPATYELEFKRPLDDPYRYLCVLHPFMRGRVRIR
jgi:plastocyanin